jgi:hypothetical protein
MRTATFACRCSGRRTLTVVTALVVAPLAMAACGDDDEGAVGATATWRAPEDGATVAGGLSVEMVADGVTIEAAGEARQGFGHFHVIVDDGCVESGVTVPKDVNHLHFGTGSTTGLIYLEPGEHELCLQVANGEHSALDVTDTATVTVAIRTVDEWCAVVGEVDELFTQADTGGEEFVVRQVIYGNVRRLMAQLTDGLDVVDADDRDTVAAAIETGSQISAAFADAADEHAADDVLEEIFGTEGADTMAEAAGWIDETCGVDVDG